jgi:hypothetical protein
LDFYHKKASISFINLSTNEIGRIEHHGDVVRVVGEKYGDEEEGNREREWEQEDSASATVAVPPVEFDPFLSEKENEEGEGSVGDGGDIEDEAQRDTRSEGNDHEHLAREIVAITGIKARRNEQQSQEDIDRTKDVDRGAEGEKKARGKTNEAEGSETKK